MVESLTDLILTRVLIFPGVYDGHGGSQDANDCRERMHLASTEEIVKEKPEFCDGVTWQEKWKRALFIDGISWETSEDRLREYFQILGESFEAVIMKPLVVVVALVSCSSMTQMLLKFSRDMAFNLPMSPPLEQIHGDIRDHFQALANHF